MNTAQTEEFQRDEIVISLNRYRDLVRCGAFTRGGICDVPVKASGRTGVRDQAIGIGKNTAVIRFQIQKRRGHSGCLAAGILNRVSRHKVNAQLGDTQNNQDQNREYQGKFHNALAKAFAWPITFKRYEFCEKRGALHAVSSNSRSTQGRRSA
jgi:hypothetical protein